MARLQYRLLQEHTINKVKRLPGAVVDLPPQLGDWLAEQGVLEPLVRPVVIATSVQTSAQVARPSGAAFDPPPRRRCCGWPNG